MRPHLLPGAGPARALLCALLVLAAPPRLPAQGPAQPHHLEASETMRAIHLLQRATYGIRPGDVEEVLRIGRAAWLEHQLHPERIDDRRLESRLARFPAATMPATELMRRYAGRPAAPASQTGAADSLRRGANPQQVASPARLALELVNARLQRAVYSERQLEEVMTDFWYNHFNVFYGKGIDRWLVAAYEREAIRPHVFGKFEDLLIATATHPAMLFYLDNWMSSAPPPGDGDGRSRPRAGRRRGINENYARELLELHTLGVDGGYTQQDVIEVARAFTGWTIKRPRSGAQADEDTTSIAFVFRPAMHDRGEKIVLGHRLPAGRAIEDGLDVLRILAHHPSTARHIATRLVQRFVADEPPQELVDEIANVFLRTGGDLREVTRALFTAEAFYDPSHHRSKVKTPFEFVASALRATGADIEESRGIVQALRSMGGLPYSEPAPTGYPVDSREWVNAGALVNRMNFALALAAGRIDGVRLDPEVRRAASDPGSLRELVGRLVPGAPTDRLEATILTDLGRDDDAGSGRGGARVLGLILGSPEFQRH